MDMYLFRVTHLDQKHYTSVILDSLLEGKIRAHVVLTVNGLENHLLVNVSTQYLTSF